MAGSIIGLDVFLGTPKDNRFSPVALLNRPLDVTDLSFSKVSAGPGSFDLTMMPTESRSATMVNQMWRGADNLLGFGLRAINASGNPVVTTFIGTTKTLDYNEADVDTAYKITGPMDEVGAMEMVTTGTTTFTDATAGKILYDSFWNKATFLDGSGADNGFNIKKYLQLLSYWAFTPTTTGVGAGAVPWNKTISIQVGPGLTLLNLLDALVNYQMISYRITQGVLEVFNWSANPTIRAGVQFRRDFLVEAPRKINLSTSVSRVSFEGSDSTYAKVYRQEDLTFRGISSYESQGNLGFNELAAIAEIRTGKYGRAADQRTFKYPLNSADPVPLPFFEFDRGDQVMAWSKLSKTYEPAIVKQITIGRDGPNLMAIVVCNDLVAEALDRIVTSINGIVGGSTAVGVSTAKLIVP